MTELERRVQVEEAWGRRRVMEPVRNAERLAEYEAVKPLLRCDVEPVESRVDTPASRTVWRLLPNTRVIKCGETVAIRFRI